MHCPICQAKCLPRAENKAYPFCSHRCQLIDLGHWLDGDYRFAGEPVDDIPAFPGDAEPDLRGHDIDDDPDGDDVLPH
jgi:endogenous inhibitor of DNA gyrase (YacG/DUF329 family)